MTDGTADTGIHHLNGDGKNQVAPGGNRQINGVFHFPVRGGPVKSHGFHPACKRLFQVQPSQLMRIGPSGSLRCLGVDKGNLQHIRCNCTGWNQTV